MSVLLLILLNEPVLNDGGGLAGGGGLLALDLDGHVLVLLQRGSEVGLLGGLGGLGLVEGQDLALGVVGLECWCLVGLEFFQVEFLDEVGCEEVAALVSMRLRIVSTAVLGRMDRCDAPEVGRYRNRWTTRGDGRIARLTMQRSFHAIMTVKEM